MEFSLSSKASLPIQREHLVRFRLRSTESSRAILGEADSSLTIARKQVQRSAAGYLQILCVEKAETKSKDLAPLIQEVLDCGQVAVPPGGRDRCGRGIGNFATHPIKSTNTGEVLEVELGEAEWLLDTLEALFDFYFVQPAKSEKKEAR